MALVLKTDKTFVNPTIGGRFGQAYLKVGRITYDKDTSWVEFYLLTYVDITARQERKEPMLIGRLEATGNEFTNHFSPDVLNTTDNIIKAVYQYLLQLKDASDNLIYADWDSDVV